MTAKTDIKTCRLARCKRAAKFTCRFCGRKTCQHLCRVKGADLSAVCGRCVTPANRPSPTKDI